MFSPVAARYPFAWHMHDTFVLRFAYSQLGVPCFGPTLCRLLREPVAV